MANSRTGQVLTVALAAVAASAILSVTASRRTEQVVRVPLTVNLKAAAADTCTDRLDRQVPLGATQCIMHDVYVCTPNQVWKKTDKHC